MKPIPDGPVSALSPGHSVKEISFDFQTVPNDYWIDAAKQTVRKEDLAIFLKPIQDVPVTTVPPGHSVKELTFDFPNLPENYWSDLAKRALCGEQIFGYGGWGGNRF